MPANPRPEYKPGRNHFGQPVEPYAHPQHNPWQEMEPPAKRTGDGLCFEMVIKSSTVFPYFVAAQLDQSRSQHHTENEPAEQNNDDHVWRTFWKGAHIQERA